MATTFLRTLSILLLGIALAAMPAGAAASEAEEFGIASVSGSLSTLQAGAHPDFSTTIVMKTDPSSQTDQKGLKKPYGTLRDVRVELPPGLLANLGAVTTCSSAEYAAGNGECPFSSQVGVVVARPYGQAQWFTASIFNLESAGEDDVARLGFRIFNVPVLIRVRVRSDSDYGATAEIRGISSFARVASVTTTIWGVPAASIHDRERLNTQESANGPTESPPRSAGIQPAPYMTNPTSCGRPLPLAVEADSYQEPGAFRRVVANLGEITGCERVGFEPQLSVSPTTTRAASVAGAAATLTIPQNLTVDGLATAQLRDTVVVLPEGLTISSTAAEGLEACSAAEVGYQVSPPPPAHCPAASQIGTAEIDSSALTRPIFGAVYQRTPEPGHLTRAWLVADELGVHVKIPGEFTLDPNTGRITALFLETPQVPVRSFKLRFKSGPHGVLATPAACGTYLTAYTLSPWSGGEPARGISPMSFTSNCGGGFVAELTAGTVSSSAAGYSPFITNLSLGSTGQNLADLAVTLPGGLLARLAGVQVCPDVDAATGGCPGASQVGTASVATGQGTSPLWIPQPGKSPTAVYLGGPYKGGPYSLIVKTPAQAGPFDLGVVVVRVALKIDEETAQISAASDPLPQLLQGIPITYRVIHLDINRPDFTLNPTSCEPKEVRGVATSVGGLAIPLSSGFQAADCGSLRFKPKLKLQLKGATKRTGHPALRAVVTYPKKGTYANIARAQVGLPHSEFLDQGNLNKVCTRPELQADNCPVKSIYGHAKAWTPLLDRPLEGPVYLGVGFGYKLPALVADLNGQVRILLKGKVDTTKHKGIRNTFEAVPDSPVSRFVLEMKGGKKYGLLENSENLCRKKQRASAQFNAQNGKVESLHPVIQNSCKRHKKSKGHGTKSRSHKAKGHSSSLAHRLTSR